MRWMFLAGCLVLAPATAGAATVCVEKATGRVLQSQNADDPGLCVQDLVVNNPQYGFVAADIEERIVDDAGHQALYQAWADNPTNPHRIKQQAKAQNRQDKENRIRATLGLTPQQFQDLKEALED